MFGVCVFRGMKAETSTMHFSYTFESVLLLSIYLLVYLFEGKVEKISGSEGSWYHEHQRSLICRSLSWMAIIIVDAKRDDDDKQPRRNGTYLAWRWGGGDDLMLRKFILKSLSYELQLKHNFKWFIVQLFLVAIIKLLMMMDEMMTVVWYRWWCYSYLNVSTLNYHH